MRLHAIDGLRGLIAIAVVLYHAEFASVMWGLPLVRNSQHLLEFFFLLSGFVLALGFQDKVRDGESATQFMVRRLGRVVPMHQFMLGLLVALALVRGAFGPGQDSFDGMLSLETLPYHLTLTQIALPSDVMLTWNFPSWTLSGEIVAYAMFAAVLVMARSRFTRAGVALACVLASGAWYFWDQVRIESYNVTGLSRILFGFFLGYLLYEVWRAFPIRTRPTAQVCEALALLALAVLFSAKWQPGPQSLFSHLLYGFVIYVFASSLGRVSSLLSWKPLVWFGNVSFSVYMFHGVVVVAVRYLVAPLERWTGFQLQDAESAQYWLIRFPEAWMTELAMASYVAVVLIGGVAIHYLIEAPTRDYFNRVAKKIRFPKPAHAADAQAPDRAPARNTAMVE